MNVQTATRAALIAHIEAHHVDYLDVDDGSENARADHTNTSTQDLRIFAGYAEGIAARTTARNTAYLAAVAADEEAEEYRRAALDAPRRAARAIADGTAYAERRILAAQEAVGF